MDASSVCEAENINTPSVLDKKNLIESLIGFAHFSGKYFFLLLCLSIKPYMITFLGIFIGIFSKIGGVVIFIIYGFICGHDNLGDDFYLIVFLVPIGISCVYLRLDK